jgi:hypothetical protein
MLHGSLRWPEGLPGWWLTVCVARAYCAGFGRKTCKTLRLSTEYGANSQTVFAN